MACSITARTGAIRLAICGGGATSVLLLDALRRSNVAVDATVIEPRERLGEGVAYSTSCLQHVLNTRAGRMSANDDPDSFLRWLREHRPRPGREWRADDFVLRGWYGDYLHSIAREAAASASLRLTHRRTRAVGLRRRGEGWEIAVESGAPVHAAAVIMATGNEPPRAIDVEGEAEASGLVIGDPWNTAAKALIDPEAPVLLMGTGLTAVDIALELLHSRRHAGPVIAFSRRGLVPRTHSAGAPVPSGLDLARSVSVRSIVRRARAYSGNVCDWREVMVELQRLAPVLWGRLAPRERRRFLRHARPYWEAHRHRLAPEVAAQLAGATGSGRLEFVRARLEGIERVARQDGSKRLRVTLSGPAGRRTIEAGALINCTGPDPEPRRGTNPLLRYLVQAGLADADPYGFGLRTDGEFRVIGPDGRAAPSLYALGPVARGHFWEVTAVPDIGQRARELAIALLREQGQRDSHRPGEPPAAFPTVIALRR